MKNVLTIAGSDPSGGAGIQRDLKTFAEFNCNGLSVITALTAQNSKKVNGVLPVTASFVKKQIETLFEEYKIDALKTGMLAAEDIVKTLAQIFKNKKQKNIVIDTVFVSTSGYPLLEKKGIKRLKDDLIPFAEIVTPNIYEAFILSGVKIKDIEDMHLAAERIKKLGCNAVLVKGGHLKEVKSQKHALEGFNQGSKHKSKVVDVLYNGKEFKLFKAKRISKDLHGTGCILSAGIAAGLANGLDIKDAIKNAKKYVTRMIGKSL
ncbi:MAG: bifunctional hydroxymethylpyrimidine kinase/phosphomethylpyrimidine kinase [Deltaproteobacteria bacterium]|nr:bifunctional hydroxymethylpyrimidine kinase/phosphomethylpyrimidine kinase [Deltaproteobacteria bacterium]